MKHKHWQPGTLMAQAYRDIANEHNATVDALEAALAPIRVPFSDEVIEKMARAASDAGDCSWPTAIRAALAAGGLDYAPQDVAFKPERASDEELEHVYEQGREFGELVNLEGIRAVRARVEAPLLAEIARLEQEAKANIECQETMVLDLRNKDAALKAVTAERDEMCHQQTKRCMSWRRCFNLAFRLKNKYRAELAALRQPVYLPSVEECSKLAQASLRDAQLSGLGNGEQIYVVARDVRDAVLAGVRVTSTSTPTDAEVEALAKSMHAKTRFIGWNEMIDAGRESWRNSARAAFAHIGRVPVAWELDVTADVIEVIARSSSRQTRAKEILDLCRSRIKPVYECKECAKMKEHFDRMQKQFIECDRRINAARAALEGE